MAMRILKLGWEFPPYSYGGLGVACEGLVRGLLHHGAHIVLVLPRRISSSLENCHIISIDEVHDISLHTIDSLLQPYLTSTEYMLAHSEMQEGGKPLYGAHLFAEIERYAHAVRSIASREQFNIIHAHDWLSFKAGIFAKQVSKKPLIVHVHATEFDRTGGNGVNQYVYDIERHGMHVADRIIAVSNFTKQKIITHYGISPKKISVLHNAITHEHFPTISTTKHHQEPLILFLGRITLQKGPDYFISMAQKLLHYRPDVRCVIAGSGDMKSGLMQRVIACGLNQHIIFTGQLHGEEVHRAYRMADVFVMPSVSEPFGLTALEAMKHGVPVIISKQSGVSEVIGHVLKVDFWDINEMVSKILGLLSYKEVRKELTQNSSHEVTKFNWRTVAQQCLHMYHACIRGEA